MEFTGPARSRGGGYRWATLRISRTARRSSPRDTPQCGGAVPHREQADRSKATTVRAPFPTGSQVSCLHAARSYGSAVLGAGGGREPDQRAERRRQSEHPEPQGRRRPTASGRADQPPRTSHPSRQVRGIGDRCEAGGRRPGLGEKGPCADACRVTCRAAPFGSSARPRHSSAGSRGGSGATWAAGTVRASPASSATPPTVMPERDTNSRYAQWDCRCADCRTAHTLYQSNAGSPRRKTKAAASGSHPSLRPPGPHRPAHPRPRATAASAARPTSTSPPGSCRWELLPGRLACQ